jgi:surfactin synthase thioesterase subunit
VLFPFAGGGAETYANFVATIKKSADDISLYFVRYLHSENEFIKVAEEIQKDLHTKQIYFYSHCVGSAVALKTLNILDKNGKCKIKHYIAGASIPAEKPVKWNSWNITPDFMLRNILVKAGAPISKLSKAELKLMMKSFRNDTDFATQYFYKDNERISCPISLVINKNDPFTTQYAKAECLWRRYSDNVSKPYYINHTSHYFQSDNSEALTKIILKIIG